MRRGAIVSGVLHVGAIVAAVVGLPRIFEPRLIEEQPMLVELVTVADVTTSQKPKAEPEPAKEQAKPEPPKPPEPEAKPEPEPPKVAEAPPPPPPPPPPENPPPPKPDEPEADGGVDAMAVPT